MIKPILFNTEMVRVIQNDTKTVTRRVVKPQPYSVMQGPDSKCWCGHFVSESGKVLVDRPPCRPGDILYVPRAWKCVGIFGELGYEVEFRDGQRVKFKFESRERAKKWAKYRDKPSNHWQSPYFMPREAARIFLRVTDVRAERLKDATEEDARAEGFGSRAEFIAAILKMYPDCAEETWLWVIEFERISREETMKNA